MSDSSSVHGIISGDRCILILPSGKLETSVDEATEILFTLHGLLGMTDDSVCVDLTPQQMALMRSRAEAQGCRVSDLLLALVQREYGG